MSAGSSSENAASIVRVLPNRLESLAAFLADFAERAAALGVPDAARRAMGLALDEMLTNVITHAWPDGGAHETRVQVAFRAGRVEALIEDDGRAFDPTALPAPRTDLPLGQRRQGGLGVHLVRSLMDEFRYRREDGRNVLLLAKGWDAAPGGGAR